MPVWHNKRHVPGEDTIAAYLYDKSLGDLTVKTGMEPNGEP